MTDTTTPRDAARDLLLAYDNAHDAFVNAHRRYLSGNGEMDRADAAQEAEATLNATRESLIAAIAASQTVRDGIGEITDAMFSRACEAYQLIDPDESINFLGMHNALEAAFAARGATGSAGEK